MGPVRDYNGGMIYKLQESITALKSSLGKSADAILIEKFFYSIVPIEMRSSLDTDTLKTMFLLLNQSIKGDTLQCKQEESRILVAMPGELQKKVTDFAPQRCVSFTVDVHNAMYGGYLYFSDEKAEQIQFLETLNFSANSAPLPSLRR